MGLWSYHFGIRGEPIISDNGKCIGRGDHLMRAMLLIIVVSSGSVLSNDLSLVARK